MADSAPKKNIVFAGGGYAAVHVINALEKTLDHSKYALVVVNPRPYYLHLISALRAAPTADAQLVRDSLMPYDGLPGVTHVPGKVVAVAPGAPGTGGALLLEGGQRVEYAALVLATGSRWSGTADFPDADEAVREHFKTWKERIARASHVVIVGGGAVGIGVSHSGLYYDASS